MGGAKEVRRNSLFHFFLLFILVEILIISWSFFSIVQVCSVSGDNVKVHSHLASTSTFASDFLSDFNIVSVGTLVLMQRMGIEPILCACVLLPLLLLFSKTQMQMLTLSVNGYITNQDCLPVELDDYADGLKHVALPLYSYVQCVERYGDPITQRMLCAGGTTEDTCQVGGALIH